MRKEKQMFPRHVDSYDWYVDKIKCDLKINKNTKIVSAGSCFAREIRYYLIKNGYNYLQYESNKNPWVDLYPGDKGRHKSEHGSCAWERVYHTYGMANICHSVFSGTLKNRLYEYKNKYYDLLRTRVVYPNKDVALLDIEDHNKCALEALRTCDVFIFTLGLIETWRFSGMTIACSPYQYKIKGEFEFHLSTFEENLRNLDFVCWHLYKENPGVKILLTVSPVHLNATFRNDVDILSATCHSKSLLRTIVFDTINKYSNVYYFPSYEIATILANILGDKTYPDGHHVNKKIVEKIMNIFEKVCCV